ncbi:putative four-helix membrane protein [Marinobacter sp. tcs-11]|uniref:putative four-helix membrane protein n=1 Tax=Marinobacter sp. tcs-11 TaxID=1742860 RepID=UPI00257FE789|nr:putative four-helix membrane protein [Marinobacter sp. tcs-11]
MIKFHNSALISLTLLTLPLVSYANRYEWREEQYGSGSNPLGAILAVVLVTWFAYWFIKNSLDERRKRQKEGRKIERKSIETDIVYPIIGYAISAFAVSAPILLLIKFIAGSSAVYDYWLLVVAICFAAILYLRQT